MSAESATDYSKLAQAHLAAYRVASREKRATDATREYRLHAAALQAARAISTYQHEVEKT